MNGKTWLEQQERQLPGFLRQAYEREASGAGFTDESDKAVAAALASVASIYGVKDLTGNVVQKARLALGMRRCKIERRPKIEADPPAGESKECATLDGWTQTFPGHAPNPEPEQPVLPGAGAQQGQLAQALWALYREVRELRKELAVRRGKAA